MRSAKPLDRHFRKLVLAGIGLAVRVSLAGCDSGSEAEEPNRDDFSFTARVNGEPYAATTILGAGLNEGGSLFIASGNDEHTLELGMEGAEAGTYAIDATTGSGGLFTVRATSTIYSTAVGGTGTVEVTSLTRDRMSGTFSFTADYSVGVGSSDWGSTVTVTNGQFDVARTR